MVDEDTNRPEDDDEDSSRSERWKERLSEVVDSGVEGARRVGRTATDATVEGARWVGKTVVDASVDGSRMAGRAVVSVGTEGAQRAGGVAKSAVERIRLRGNAPPSADDFEALWPVATGHGEVAIAEQIRADSSADAVTEDLLTVATLTLGGVMAELTSSGQPDVSQRIGAALGPRTTALFESANEGEAFNLEALLAELGGDLTQEQRLSVLLDLWFIDPFSPYEIEVPDRIRRHALDRVAECLGWEASDVDVVGDVISAALKAHRSGTLRRVALFGIGGVLVIGTAGFLAAPAIAAAIGAGAGLSGAAATSYGLAVLGGGAVATGGAGMTGGLWLLAGVGGALGGVGGFGGSSLYELGANQVRIEVVKLQATYRLMLLDQQIDTAKAQEVSVSLTQRIEELRAQIEVEEAINDKNSSRVEDLEEKLEALVSGRDWMADMELSA